ncbi:MAG TPA: glycosyltransferase family 2 protein [Bacteroidia bacterium]|jgi:dolichol-phosphate mannosyltransferase|nr:glycosyltransferase family 2 protein [Bacteroidia bacterium]
MIYVLIPIFNEEGNVENLHNELSTILPGEEKMFVFSDDGSTDKTIELLRSYFSNTNFTILGDGVNRGPGYAFNTGFEWILENSKNIENDIVITMEADCTSDIGILPHMLGINKMGYDLVLASVYAQGGGFDSTSFIRKFLSAIANLLFRFLFDLKVLTLSSFYRVYSLGLLQKIKQNYPAIITEYGFICMLEILVKAMKQGAKIIEVPMMLRSKKRVGKSKLKVLKTTMAYFRFLLFKKN